MLSLEPSISKGLYHSRERPCHLSGLENKLGGPDNQTATAFIEQIRNVAKSVGGLMHSKDFEAREQDDPWSVSQDFFASEKGTLNRDAKKDLRRREKSFESCNIDFEEEPCLATGTAFLIAKDLALTAGHCFFESPCKEEDLSKKLSNPHPDLLVFDFDTPPRKGSEKKSLSFADKDVYQIKSVIAYELFGEENNQTRDWALLKLDRAVTEDRKPLEVDFSSEIEEGMSVWMVGHLRGISKKWRGNAIITQKVSVTTDKSKQLKCPHFFGSNLAAFTGDSGAPILDKETGHVIGMLCNGNLDYKVKNGVIVESIINKEKIEKRGYEHALKMSSLNFLEAFFSSNPLFLPNPSNKGQARGITLEGVCCNKLNTVPIIHGKMVDILKESLQCSECKSHLKDKVMVLFDCKYKIQASKTKEKRAEGVFLFHRVNSSLGGEMRFNLQEWETLRISWNDPGAIEQSFAGALSITEPTVGSVAHLALRQLITAAKIAGKSIQRIISNNDNVLIFVLLGAMVGVVVGAGAMQLYYKNK